jgi:diguanylate cyclase (GGDEF)-like protein
MAVLFADIVQFRSINSQYGWRAGDMLLKALAARLARLVSPRDTLGRLENDTSVVICRHLDDSYEAESRAARRHLVSNGVFGIFDTKLSVRCTVGPLFTGNAGDIPAHLLDRTGTAIHEARANKVFDSEVIDLTAMSKTTYPFSAIRAPDDLAIRPVRHSAHVTGRAARPRPNAGTVKQNG